jgi:hypothetical protein
METQTLTFASSPFVPCVIGFLGMGTGYFIWHVLRQLRCSDHGETCRHEQRSLGLSQEQTPAGTAVVVRRLQA